MVQQIRPQVTARQGGKVSRLALAVASGYQRRGTLSCLYVPQCSNVTAACRMLFFCDVILLEAQATPHVYLMYKG